MNVSFSFVVELSLYFVALFFLCMVCHGELVRPDPLPVPDVVLPDDFRRRCAGRTVRQPGGPGAVSTFLEWKIGLVVGCASGRGHGFGQPFRGVAAAALLSCPGLVLLFVGLNYFSRLESGDTESSISSRSFYGVSRVIDRDSDNPAQHKFLMYSGRIVHGVQFADPGKHLLPNAYFGTESGCGQRVHVHRQSARSYRSHRPGRDTMATYAQPGQRFRFYEINPDMLRLADKYFSYLKDCRGQAEVKLGDGRLTLEREAATPNEQFDLLVLDAFSGDSVPAHLLTKKAFEIYHAAAEV